MPAKRRYKIEKRVRDHNKKLRKEMKKKDFKKKPKDPGIPNSLPFKEQILTEIKEHKKRADEYREVVKAQMKQNRQDKRDKAKANNRKMDLKELAEDAQIRDLEFENRKGKSVSLDPSIVSEKDGSNLKSFYKDIQKVVEESDIIIEVLDSRDPLGTRCFEVEEMVVKNYSNKRIILLLNKTDLVPRDNLKNWITYLRNEYATIPFKASTQSQKQNLSRSKVNVMLSSDDLLKSSKCLGAEVLMKMLNNYCRNKDIKTSINVGIVGFPNVGKSSVINSLKRNQVCTVGPTPGLTKAMQTINLDKHIRLLDSPGIVFAKREGQQSASMLALRNAVKIESLSDPALPVEALLNRVNRKDLMTFYQLTEFNSVKEFLALVAKRFGKMLKGGILDLKSAAIKVLQDWNNGKIKYCTLPPEKVSTTIDSKIVSVMSEEFNIEDFKVEECMNVDDAPTEAFLVKSFKDHDQDTMMESDTLNTQIILEQSKPSTADAEDVEMEELEGMQLNKSKKVQFKKLKKQRKRDQKLSNKLDSIAIDEDYDFDTYF